MSIEKDIFLKSIPNFDKLLNYGFCKKDDTYFFECLFFNNEFKAVIFILKDGHIKGQIFDCENNEEYLPWRIENQEGSFIGEVRNEYIKILEDIKNKCFEEKLFVSEQGNRISEKIKNAYGHSPVFMWDKYPTFGVFKNPDNNKWYGLIMYIERAKLGEPSNELVEVMNLKADDKTNPELIKKDGIYPAYHMNKKYWISICLDDTLTDSEIMSLIDKSYSYTLKRKN